MEQALKGRLDNLPVLHSQIVRVFISSTFTDTHAERNLLIRDVYPKLKEYCRKKYALDFQVVDMRWGVRDESSDDHMTSSLCLQEIRNCQSVSVGPSFVTLLGQRYGFRPIPASIESTEMKQMLKVLSGEESELVASWYREDLNAIPPVYVLQRISSRLPAYISKDDAERQAAKSEWERVFGLLQQMLRKAAEHCLSEEHKAKYFISVTEAEVCAGMFDVKDLADHQCLCYIRIISDIEQHLSHPRIWRFIDLQGSDLDSDAKSQLERLRDNQVPRLIPKEKIKKSSVLWSDEDEGIGEQSHGEYLKEFCQNFYDAMVKHIDRAMSEQNVLQKNELYTEIMQHLRLARSRCDVFYGREDLLDSVQNIISINNRQPVVIHGQSGCGKTSIMAKIVEQIPSWLQNTSPKLIVRFLGTTPKSSGIIPLLRSVNEQIATSYQATYEDCDTFSDVIQQFTKLLEKATEKCPLVIILDSLDQLSSDHYAHKLYWLPRTLPDNVYIVVSTIPDIFSILPRLRKRIENNNFVRVHSLGDELGTTVLFAWLSRINRKLTNEQQHCVSETLRKCSLPLYTRLLYENVSLWKSYTQTLCLPDTIRGIINALFNRLETIHGKLFVSHALGYITASKNGLSENELEDIISLDDEVLSEAFQYHVPPIRRIPQLLIVRLHGDICHYVVNREADGMTVLYWYHRHFIEAATDRYLKNDQDRMSLHHQIAHFYLGTWSNAKKEFTYTASQAKKLGLKSRNSAEDRRVAAQPLVLNSQMDNKLYNKRKLANMAYHLYQAGSNENLVESCLLNYHWLDAKIRAFSLNETLDDFDFENESTLCKQLRLSLNLARSTLSQYPETLASEILSRMLHFDRSCDYGREMQKLLENCIMYGSTGNALVPKQQVFDRIDERLKYELEHPELSVKRKLAFLSSDGRFFYAIVAPNTLVYWDLQSGEIIQQVPIHNGPVINVLKVVYSRNNDSSSDIALLPKFALFASSQQRDENHVALFNFESGEIERTTILRKKYQQVMFEDQLQLDYSNGMLWMNAVGNECSVFDMIRGDQIHVFEDKPTLFEISPFEEIALLYSATNKSVAVHCVRTLQLLHKVELDVTPLKFAFSTDGTFVLHNNDSKISLWDLKSGDIKERIVTTFDYSNLVNDLVFDFCLSPDLSKMAVCHKEGVLIWNIKFNKEEKRCPIPEECKPVFHRVLSYKTVFTANCVAAAFEGYVILWDLKVKKIYIYRASNDTNRIIDIQSSANPSFDVLVAVKERARLFKILDVKKIQAYKPLQNSKVLRMSSGVRYLSVARTNGLGVCRTYDSREVCVFDTSDGVQKLPKTFQNLEVMQPLISSDGQYLLLNSFTFGQKQMIGNLHVYCTKSGTRLRSIPVSSVNLRTFNFSHSGDLIVTHSEESVTKNVQLEVWKVCDDASCGMTTISCELGGVSAIECVLNDSFVITLHNYTQLEMDGENCDLRIFDTTSGEQLHHSSGYARDTITTIVGQNFFYISKIVDGRNKVCMFSLKTMQLEEINIFQVGKMYVDETGKRGIDTAIQVFDLVKGKTIASFGKPSESQIRQNPQTYPKISASGMYVAWFELSKACVLLGNVDQNTVVGRGFIHSTPLSLRFCYRDILAVGCEEGYIFLYQQIGNETKIESLTEDIMKHNKKESPQQKSKSSTCCLV